jgi:two-component system, LuxR family, response regulator FixJ
VTLDSMTNSASHEPQSNLSVDEGGAARERHAVAVIDDDAAVCDSTRMLLEVLDFEVYTYANAAEFFAINPNVSCLIVDYHMSGMNGIELTAEFRKRGDSVPVIMITASNDPRIEARAVELGIKSVLKKPLGKALVAALDSELS